MATFAMAPPTVASALRGSSDMRLGSRAAHVTPGMIEGNVGLQFGMHAHRYGEQRAALAERLSKVSADNVREAVRNHLSAGKAAVCTLSSEAAATGD
jgi:hypothetical protein